MSRLLVLILALAPSLAWAATPASPQEIRHYQRFDKTVVLDTTAINVACSNVATATVGCASFTLDTRGYSKVWLMIQFTKASATAVQVYQDGAIDLDDDGAIDDLPWGVFQAGNTIAAPTIAMGDFARVWTSPSSATWFVEFEVNAPWSRFRFTSTGGAAGDTVKVWQVKMGQ